MVGKVLEVFIPDANLDSINPQKLGFKITTINQKYEFIVPCNEMTSLIFKDDFVTITEENGEVIIKNYVGDINE